MITAERGTAAEALFRAALERTPAERAALLAQAGADDPELRQEVESLLAHLHAARTFLERPPLAGSGSEAAEVLGAAPLGTDRLRGRRLGSYEILDLLAEGGMGVVYLAQQDHPPRRVALKLLRPGLATPSMLRRFEHEAEILGRLQHPGIAQILEAGTAETGYGPQPFFAMEFIDGQRLTDYADAHRLSSRQRLELLEKVCDAVHYAHQQGVIHRDLKPANILVDAAGQPKVLDFGVSRVAAADLQPAALSTGSGQLLGTIPYMSPEQVAGDPRELDTRSDVHALGVVGYELLTGRLPYALENKPLGEALRVIAEEIPVRLSSIQRTLRGDVETIFGRALEKDKNRRYPSVSALSADLRCYLRDEPITARSPTALYLLSKFARRNSGLALGVALAFIGLMFGVIAATAYALAASRAAADARRAEVAANTERTSAEQARDESEAVTQFLEQTLAKANPKDFGQDVTVKQVLAQASQTLDVQFANEPLVAARLHWVVGVAYRWQAAYDQAAAHLTRALVLRREQLGEMHPDVATTYGELGIVLKEKGDYAGAEAYIRRALAIEVPLLGEDHEDVGGNRYHLAVLLQARCEYAEAETLFRQALRIARKAHGEEHRHVATCLSSLAEVRFQQNDYAEAETLARLSLAIRQRVLGEEHAEVALSLRRLGRALQAQGDYAGAEPLLRQALAIRQKAFGQQHPFVAESLGDLAALLQACGDAVTAAAHYRQALAIYEARGELDQSPALEAAARLEEIALAATPEEGGKNEPASPATSQRAP
jgi:eukaryotic-like serine/threonine-protein kinase